MFSMRNKIQNQPMQIDRTTRPVYKIDKQKSRREEEEERREAEKRERNEEIKIASKMTVSKLRDWFRVQVEDSETSDD